MVKKEREAIILFPKISTSAISPAKGSVNTGAVFDKKASALLEMEHARMEALRRRQEKEMAKMIDKEKVRSSE
jgi:hypothetical protein